MSATNKDLVAALTIYPLWADAAHDGSPVAARVTCAGLAGDPSMAGVYGNIVYYPQQSAGRVGKNIDIPPDPGV